MSMDCPRGGKHEGGPPQREGGKSVIRCTKCDEILSTAELPGSD